MRSSPPPRNRHPPAWPGRLLLVVTVVLAMLSGWATPASATPRATAPSAKLAAAVAQPVLRLGSRGAAVVRPQQRLAGLRYDLGAVDGVFGASTYHAVVAFQKVNALARDGIVGPRTWAALARPVRPGAFHYTSGYALEINLSRQVVKLIYQGKVARLLDASTGKASTPTPRGSFHVTRRINGWRQSPLGLMWRPNYFYGGYAVHGSTSVPAYAASHGCVRVTIAAMNRLWPNLRIGTPVWVYRG
jgi:N-acetylmuramoyl-L-alanine amidase